VSTPADEPFSAQLERWLRADQVKTLGSLADVFAEKSFAVSIVLLMFLPAIPLPTGGISHVFEAITVLIAAQMVLGRQSMWLPNRWKGRPLGDLTTDRAIPLMVRWIRRFERFSKPRGVALFRQRSMLRLCGLALVALAITAALAPPFSGLDTLPAMGAVTIAMSIILEDAVLLAVGVVIGSGGAIVIFTVGAALARAVRHLF
jgi:hypothetical protein